MKTKHSLYTAILSLWITAFAGAQSTTEPKFPKIIEIDLNGTARELLMKADDTQDLDKYFTYTTKAIELAKGDPTMTLAGNAAMINLYCHLSMEKQADSVYKEIEPLYKNTNDPYINYRFYYAQADVYYIHKELEKSLTSLQKALTASQNLPKLSYRQNMSSSIARVYTLLNRTQDAIDFYRKAIAATPEDSNLEEKAGFYSALGNLYHASYKYKESLEAHQKALTLWETLNNKMGVASENYWVAQRLDMLDKYEESTLHYQKAATLFEELGSKEDLINSYSALAEAVMRKKGNTRTEAMQWASRAYNTAYSLNDKYYLMTTLFTLAYTELDFNETSQMRRRLTEGLKLAKELNHQNYITKFQSWLGIYHDIRGEFNLALPYYQLQVEAAEKSRKEVAEEYKLDFWKETWGGYSNIITCQLQLKDFPGAINSIERSSGRLLFENIAKKMGKTDMENIEIQKIQKDIPQNQAVLFYGNAGGQESAVITATNSAIGGRVVNADMWVKTIQNKYSIPAIASVEMTRGFKNLNQTVPEEETVNPKKEKQKATGRQFEDIVNHYRGLLSKPTKDPADIETLQFLGQKFYQLLIKPIEASLAGKTELVIVPNDVLAFLPFEAFITTDGKYLVEKYDIRYLPSYSIGVALQQRTYPSDRKPILAFGNAIYNAQSAAMNDRGFKSDGTQANLEQQNFNNLMKGILESIKKGENMSKYYKALGYAWDNLPGTLAEVDALKVLKPEAVVIKGKEVSKNNVKQLSKTGQLKNYKIVHFATHGVVIPEFQELSALVLSQGIPGDDGYLRASEVSALDLRADFVNLSACETGLGKIYGGEGVVGLSQSFLLSGANSVAVSLWQVSDASTMEFQKELYRLIFVENMPPMKAIATVKRAFINRDDYKQPFYWAPFVFYGM